MHKWLKLTLTILFAIAIALIVSFAVRAQSARYQMVRIDNAGYFWSWSADKPYTVIRQLCWNDQADTWCEPTLNFARMTYIYEVIDWEAGNRTSIYQLRRGGCVAWQWHNDYGTDGQPHIAYGDLITCP